MKNKPKVSVLIPNYNHGKYIGEAIESVLGQTFQDFELIVVDNNSTDNSVEIVKQYQKKDKRIKLYINEENIGMYKNYNQALLYASGEYIKFLNSDDKLHPDNLQKMSRILDTYENVSLVTSLTKYIGDKSGVRKIPYTKEGIYSFDDIFKTYFTEWGWIGEPTVVMFRRKNLYLGFFDISLPMFADNDMWLRQLIIGDLYLIAEPLSYFRRHEKQGARILEKEYGECFFLLQKMEYIFYFLNTNRFNIMTTKSFYKELKDSACFNNFRIVKCLLNSKDKYLIRRHILCNWACYLKAFYKKIIIRIK